MMTLSNPESGKVINSKLWLRHDLKLFLTLGHVTCRNIDQGTATENLAALRAAVFQLSQKTTAGWVFNPPPPVGRGLNSGRNAG